MDYNIIIIYSFRLIMRLIIMLSFEKSLINPKTKKLIAFIGLWINQPVSVEQVQM